MTILSIFTICVFMTVVYGQSYSNVTGLKTTLLTSYDASVIPLANQSDIMNVNLTLYVLSILEIDQVKGAITFGVKLKHEWYDELIQWTPSSYDGISELNIPSSDVWTPPLVVGNPVSFTELTSSFMTVHYSSDGHATLTPISTLDSTCTFYMKYWPYDKQQCDLTFFPFGYGYEKVALSVTSKGFDVDWYSLNPEWTLLKDMLSHEVGTGSGLSMATFKFKIARQPSFYMLTVIMPINGIGMLTCLVFLLPSESGERVSYAITIMLALAVFLTVTAAELPKTSEPVPILCIYILFNMMVCFGAVIFVVLNLILYYRDDKVPIPKWCVALVRWSKISRWCKRNKKAIKNVEPEERQKSKTSGRRISQVTPIGSGNRLNNEKWTNGKLVRSKSQDEEKDDVALDEEVTWQTVSKAIDRLMFYMLVVVTYVPSIIILLVLSMSADFGPE